MELKSSFSRKFIQLGVVVRDINKTTDRLKLLGLGPFKNTTLDMPPMTGYFRGKPSTSKEKLLSTMMGEVELELFEPVEGKSPWQEFLDNKGEGIHHIGFAPNNLDKDIASFTERGVKVLHSAKWDGGGGAYLELGVADIILELYQEGNPKVDPKKSGTANAKPPFSNKLIHLGIIVRDIDKAVKRLESLNIGPFNPFDRNSLPPFVAETLYKGKPLGDPGCKVMIAKIGELELELFEPFKPGTPWKDYLDKKGEGIHHIAFREYDLENDVARLIKQGATLLVDAKWEGGGSAYLDLGVGGIIIELEQK
jgi:catechol 2,3-dioxygenase-like lactoylglutathione lyase family enzyme